MKKISSDCPNCSHFQTLSFEGAQQILDFNCGHCQHAIHTQGLDATMLDICPVCQCDKLYQHKDFNKAIGFLVFIIGAVLIPWTYAISIIVALLIDAALYPFFPWMQVCYFCKSELRGFAINPKLDRFNHETAAHFEYGKKNGSRPKSLNTISTHSNRSKPNAGFLHCFSAAYQFLAHHFFSLLAAFFSGAILVCISPPLNWHALHWVSFVPLFLALAHNRRTQNFFWGWFCGFVAVFFLFFWLIETLHLFSKLPVLLALPVYMLFCAVFAIPYGIVCSSFEFWRRAFPNGWMYPLALSWVAVEYLTPALFPYYQGLSQYRVPVIWQTVSILGVSGLTFLVILTNGLAADFIFKIRAKQKIKWLIPSSVIVIFIVISGLGFWRVNALDQDIESAPVLKVGLVQIKEPIQERMQYSRNWQTKLLLRQSKRLIHTPLDLMVWPEGGIARDVNDPTLDTQISEVFNGAFALLTGSRTNVSTEGETTLSRNSALLFGPDNQLIGSYDKMVLIPFGESIPKSLAFLNPNLGNTTVVEAGLEPTLLTLDNLKISTPICYEAILRAQMLRLANADVIINLTEDGWFGDTAAPHQHAMLAAASATELGRPFVRSVINGVNLVVAPNGRFLYETQPYQDKADVIKVPLVTRQTFYTLAGHYFGPACFVLVLVLILWQKKWLQS